MHFVKSDCLDYNCGDLVTRIDGSFKRFSRIICVQTASKSSEQVKAKVEANNSEKQIKEITNMSDDIINLNVGGKKLTTLRSTLCQVEDSLLATMFSGRWEDNITRDKDGAVFFDFNPQHFILILDYLRIKKIATPENRPPFPKVPEDQEESFYCLVQYLGLSKEITVSCKIAQSSQTEKFSLVQRSHGISLEEGRKVAVCDENGGEYVLGENVYNGGTVNLKLQIESYQKLFVGITEGDVKLLSQNLKALSSKKRNISRRWPGSYGWEFGLGHACVVCKDGSNTTDTNLQNITQQLKVPYTAKLVLDGEAGKLSLYLSTAEWQGFHMDIPKSKMWRLDVTLYYANQRIRIVDD